jgi:glycosyltransferase involved in cell wall biosynthesis
LTGDAEVYYFTDATRYGGAEKSLANLISGLDRRRWRPTLVYHDDGAIHPLLAAARRLEVELWPVPRMPEGLVGARRALKLAAELRRRRPDVFHAQLTWSRSCKFGLAAALLARVPAVLATEHAFVDVAMTRFTRLQMRVLAARVDRYIAVSEYLRQRLTQSFDRPAQKSVVIPNGVDPDSYRATVDADLRACLSACERFRVVLSLSRLDPEKGLPVLLRALAELPEVQVAIAGDGPQRSELVALADELNIADRVAFLGHRDDVAQLLACCDVFVQPSLNEALPLGPLEAMCAGKPVVASAVGGTPEVVRSEETGVLVPPADPHALAVAIDGVLSDPARAAALAQAGKRHAASFSIPRMAGAVMALYEHVLSDKGADVPPERLPND